MIQADDICIRLKNRLEVQFRSVLPAIVWRQNWKCSEESEDTYAYIIVAFILRCVAFRSFFFHISIRSNKIFIFYTPWLFFPSFAFSMYMMVSDRLDSPSFDVCFDTSFLKVIAKINCFLSAHWNFHTASKTLCLSSSVRVLYSANDVLHSHLAPMALGA